MRVSYSVKLPKPEVIEKAALRALRSSLNGTLNRAARKITVNLRRMLIRAIQDSPEYKSIHGGRLQAELGLTDPSKLDEIIQIWANSIVVKVRSVRFSRGKITGGFRISAIKQDWSDVLGHPASKQPTKKGELPWLEWLLTFGDKVIVRDYDVTFAPKAARRGRTGKAIMVKGKGKRWRVPPTFSGTTRRNFVTRSLESIRKPVEAMITKEVLKQVK